MLTGSCLCGAVKYEVSGEIRTITHCHCRMCRKAHGSAFGTYGNVLHSEFRVIQGAESVGRYQSSPAVTRTFCLRCGSNLQWFSSVDHPEITSISIGTLDGDFIPKKQAHIFVESKARWFEINDGWPQKKM